MKKPSSINGNGYTTNKQQKKTKASEQKIKKNNFLSP